MVGDSALFPVIPFAVYALGGSAAEIAVVFGAEYVALTLLALFGGVVGDRRPRRSVMIMADLARFAVQMTVAVFFLVGVGAVWQLVVAGLVLGLGSAFFEPALTGMVPQTVGASDLQAANGSRGLAAAVASMVGPALGGAILVLASPGWAFAVNALTFLVSAVLLSRVHAPGLIEEDLENERSVLTELAEGWAEFRRRTWLWAMVVGFGVLNTLVFAPFYVLGPQIMDDAGTWSAVLGSVGLGAVGGALLVRRWQQPAHPLLMVTLAVTLWGPLQLLLGAGSTVAAVLVAGVFAGAGSAVFDVLWVTTLQSLPEPQISRLSSYDLLGSMATLPLGYLIAALAASTIGPETGLLIGAVVLCLTTASWLSLASIRRFVLAGRPGPSSARAVPGRVYSTDP